MPISEATRLPPPAGGPPAWMMGSALRADWERVLAGLRAHGTEAAACPPPCRALLDMPGKCLRAGLLLVSARFGAARGEAALALAVAVELVHLATLYHDDVVDDAPLRRGLPVPARLWGNAAAVYSGGYLLADAIAAFADAGDAASRLAASAIMRLWRGEMEEMENLGNVDLPLARHLRIVRNKTGALFELPCALGAHIAAVPGPWSFALRRFGARVGVAFQILDDLRDLVAGEAATGKLPGIDVREGVCTLAVLHAARQSREEAARLRLCLGGASRGVDLAQIRAIVERTGSLPFARNVALACLRSAGTSIMRLPPGDASESLHGLVRSLQQDLAVFA